MCKACSSFNKCDDDVIISIFGLVPDYVVGRSASRRWKKKIDPRCRFLIPTPPWQLGMSGNNHVIQHACHFNTGTGI